MLHNLQNWRKTDTITIPMSTRPNRVFTYVPAVQMRMVHWMTSWMKVRQKVETELTADLWPFRGAFCAPVTERENNFLKMLFGNDAAYCGTRFLVCNSIVMDEETKQQLAATNENAAEIVDTFLRWGGVPDCAQQMTIFAQAYGKESFAVIDTIANSTLSEEPIRIERIEITNWGKTNGDPFVPENGTE